MTDEELQQEVLISLDCEPGLNATDIVIAVEEGVVMLWGSVASYAEKVIAEHVARSVYGTEGVGNDLVVDLAGGFETAARRYRGSTLAARERYRA